MKRKRPNHAECKGQKKLRPDEGSDRPSLPSDGILRACYPAVQPLRAYLASLASKKRRKAILDFAASPEPLENSVSNRARNDLVKLLDRVVIGSFSHHESVTEKDEYLEGLKTFTQRRSESVSTASTSSQQSSVCNIVEYCIWSLFRKHSNVQYPPHILCHGYTRNTAGLQHGVLADAGCEIPGLLSHGRNPYVTRLKSEPWTVLPDLLGQRTEKIMVDLILNCGIFDVTGPVEKNWLQICGTPMPDLPRLETAELPLTAEPKAITGRNERKPVTKPNSIRFVRHRMLYGKAVLNARGNVTFGHRPIHALNRYTDLSSSTETLHVAKYIFPRQFGLHNAFTRQVTKEESAQPFLDYTLRDDEIATDERKQRRSMAELDQSSIEQRLKHLPKRLRGAPFGMVSSIRKRHQRCPYSPFLQHYCPSRSQGFPRPGDPSIPRTLDLATPASEVSAFCRAVVNKVFPSACWGIGEAGKTNRRLLSRCIDAFVRLGRYESMTLHTVLDGFRLSALHWLAPSHAKASAKLALSDIDKRREMISELIYYLFDSFIIPLLSTNFYITESSALKNQLLYFRQDVWLRLSSPALQELQTKMFEEVKPSLRRKLETRGVLGTSRVRLLPKDSGLRPIINLRRRIVTKMNGRMVLGKSINTNMRPAFSVLSLAKDMRPNLLGSSMFSADELFHKLQMFRSRLEKKGMSGRPLYFAKVDVKACFDSIPQKELLRILDKIIVQDRYTIGRHAEGKLLKSKAATVQDRVAWKYHSKARSTHHDVDLDRLLSNVEGDGGDAADRVYIDKLSRKQESRSKVLETFSEHIERNLVHIGKKLYRQKVGIPQGSVASSLLCSLFYGQLDGERLDFVQNDDCMLARLIDDFLLITPHLELAKRFVSVMHAGMPEYGVTIKIAKSRTNFPLSIDGVNIQQPPSSVAFPWCGLSINTLNLNISADKDRRKSRDIRSAVTIEHARLPGQSFYRKALDMAKLHMHSMLLSTSFNQETTVMDNLYHAFTDIGWRCVYYLDGLLSKQQIGSQVIIRTIEDLIDFTYALMKKRRHVKGQVMGYECAISKIQTQRIAYEALLAVFQRRQTKLRIAVDWMRMRLSQVQCASAGSSNKNAARGSKRVGRESLIASATKEE